MPEENQRDGELRQERDGRGDRLTGRAPDVSLDAPQLKVDELNLNLLRILNLEVKGLEAELNLKVDLENLTSLLRRIVDALDDNTDTLQPLLDAVSELASNALKNSGREKKEESPDDTNSRQTSLTDSRNGGSSGNRPEERASRSERLESPELATAVLRVVEKLGLDPSALEDLVTDGESGHTVQCTVDELGNILKITLNESGEVFSEEFVGSVADLPVEEEHIDERGRIVGRARDESGNTFEQVTDDEGNFIEARPA